MLFLCFFVRPPYLQTSRGNSMNAKMFPRTLFLRCKTFSCAGQMKERYCVCVLGGGGGNFIIEDKQTDIRGNAVAGNGCFRF